MAITYPLIMPTAVINIATITLRKQEPQNISVSPWTGVQQVQNSQGQWWEADVGLPPLTRAQADAWEVFILKLAGAKGTFLMGDPEHTAPRGIGGGNPVIDGVGQTGNTVSVKSCPANLTGWLLAGDFVQIGDAGTARLYRVLEDVDTTNLGTASLTLWPNMRRATIDGEPLTIYNAQGRFRMTPGAKEFARVPMFTTINFTAMEALDGNT